MPSPAKANQYAPDVITSFVWKYNSRLVFSISEDKTIDIIKLINSIFLISALKDKIN